MDLERINVALRPRGEWEAIDLGLRLAQRHASVLYPAWFLSSAPLAIVLGIAFVQFGNTFWAFALFWWFKPLFERPVLHLLGRLIFDDRPADGELRRVAWRMPFKAAWLRSITWGRLDLSRSFSLPVWQLEGLRGSARSRRAGVLALGSGGAAILLSLGTFAAVLLLFVALFSMLMSVMVADLVSFNAMTLFSHAVEVGDTIANGGPLLAWSAFALYYLCEGLIAPAYVGGGFSLYLNRRTHIEAWDVELQFRRAIKRRGLQAAALVLTVFAGSVVLAPQPASAQPSDEQPQAAAEDPAAPAREQMREAIDAILADRIFGRVEKRMRWREKQREDAEETPRELPDVESESALGKLFGSAAEIILWLLVGIGVIAALLTSRRWLPLLLGDAARTSDSVAASRSGLLLDEGDVPDDLATQVRSLWQAGRHREAAALLYRGTLTLLNERHSLAVHSSDTEGDCLRRVRAGTDAGIASYFARLTRTWQSLAYAHLPVADEELEQLCRDFKATVDVVA